jgi:hypothetical protein
MAERRIIDFDNFAGGEYGILEPWRAPPGSWTGKNIVQYDNGSLGPRNGLREITLSTAIPGTIYSAGPYIQRTQSSLWVMVDNGGSRSIKVIDRDGVVTSITGTPPAFTEPVESLVHENVEYFSVCGHQTYKIAAGAWTAIPNSPGTRCFTKYGERFLAAGGDASPKGPSGSLSPANRIWYSAPDDPEDWPSLNFIDVFGSIVGLFPQRSHLVVITTEGWWIITGVPGVNDTLRRQNRSEFPTWPTQATVIEPSMNLAYVHGSLQERDGETEGEIATHSLGVFSGTTVEYASHIPFGSGQNILTTPPTYEAVTLRGPEDLLVQGGIDTAKNRAVLFRNRAWQRIEWQAPVDLLGWCISMRRTDRHQFLSHQGGTVRLFEWMAYNNRPAFTSDVRKKPGDASTTPFTAEFTLPEWHDDQGSNAGLVDLVVDFTSWNTGSPATNHFEIVPTVLRTFSDEAQAAPTLVFDEAGSASAATLRGTRRRIRFPAVARGLDGTGFQLAFKALRGVAINRVQVLVEIDGPRVGE